MTTIIITYSIVHLLCAFAAYGTAFAFFQRKYAILAERDYRTDMGMCIFIGLGGPVSLFVLAFLCGFWEYGFKIK